MSGFAFFALGHKDKNPYNTNDFKVIKILGQYVEVAGNLLCLVKRVRMVRTARK